MRISCSLKLLLFNVVLSNLIFASAAASEKQEFSVGTGVYRLDETRYAKFIINDQTKFDIAYKRQTIAKDQIGAWQIIDRQNIKNRSTYSGTLVAINLKTGEPAIVTGRIRIKAPKAVVIKLADQYNLLVIDYFESLGVGLFNIHSSRNIIKLLKQIEANPYVELAELDLITHMRSAK